MDILWTSTQFS